MSSHPILNAIFQTSYQLISSNLTIKDQPFIVKNGLISSSTFDFLSEEFKLHPINNIDSNSSFLKSIDKLYSLPVNETVFTSIYVLRNLIYNYLCSSHKTPLFSYNKDKVSSLIKKINKCKNKKVTITMTSCKRLDLFSKTVNSMIECITDLEDHIYDWIVVDDNSSESDRNEIKKLYPFINLIAKTPEDKGHPKSMNIIIKNLYTPYQFHIEDDWEFFIHKPYCKLLIDQFSYDSSIKQVLVNINYTEDQISANPIKGSEMIYNNNNNKRLFIHRYFTGKQLEEENRKLNAPNCMYWPHYSFRVGMTDTSIYKKLGEYSLTDQHFEREYGFRFVAANYKTSFLDGIFCTHIGRRTYERDTDKKNAYDLNNEIQFGELKDQDDSFIDNNIDLSTVIEINVINLERRIDRLISFFNKHQHLGLPFRVFNAIDGKKLEPCSKIQTLCSTGDYNYRRGIIGCALSHIQLWQNFIKDARLHYLIVLEDDVTLTKYFPQKLYNILSNNKPNSAQEFELLFLHYNPYLNYRYNKLYMQYSSVEIEIKTTEESMMQNMGSGAAYILTKQGAKKLLTHINKNGLYHAIDWVMMKAGLKTGYTSPMLAFAECIQTGSLDTDIQNIYESVQFDHWNHYELNRWKTKLNSLVSIEDNINNNYLSFIGIDQDQVNNNEDNKIIIIQNLTSSLLMSIDKVIVTGIENLEMIKNMKLPYTWYMTKSCIFIIPFKYVDEDILNNIVLNDNKLLI